MKLFQMLMANSCPSGYHPCPDGVWCCPIGWNCLGGGLCGL
uniref:Uncharacterized protein n=1 Tax=Schmidtea mediterranea TaxID=79327 RepID=I1ZIB2_SCHMD|nr:hypothetical protein [Schmidtea mediterranea]